MPSSTPVPTVRWVIDSSGWEIALVQCSGHGSCLPLTYVAGKEGGAGGIGGVWGRTIKPQYNVGNSICSCRCSEAASFFRERTNVRRRGSCSVAGGYWMITEYQYCIDRQKQRQSNGCISNNETTEHALMIGNVVMTTYYYRKNRQHDGLRFGGPRDHPLRDGWQNRPPVPTYSAVQEFTGLFYEELESNDWRATLN